MFFNVFRKHNPISFIFTGEYAHGKKQKSYSLLFNPYIDCNKHYSHSASGSYVCTK